MKIIKIGGSLITKKSGFAEADRETILSISDVIADVWKEGMHELIVVHGAGSFGHPVVANFKINNGIRTSEEKRAFALTHMMCSQLSQIFVDALIEKNVPAISIPPISLGFQRDKKLLSFNSDIILRLIKSEFLPVLYGDMLLDERLGVSVCSGDQIVSYLSKYADEIIYATDVDGILVAKKLVDKITRDNLDDVLKHVGGSSATDVTGGMRGKLHEIISAGKKAYIVNGRYPERLKALLKGKRTICTEIIP
jgi:isopentenyl phosphate kinase